MGMSPCCGSSVVVGGSFYRTYDGVLYTDMTNPATVSDFRLDTYEVTVGRFRQFVNAGQGTQASPPPTGAGARTLNGMTSQAGWDPAWNASLLADTATLVAAVKCQSGDSWTDAPGANEALPMDCISWFEAFAFCTWDGGFLPTEAEWNYAASGGGEQRVFPWSNPPSSQTGGCSYANYRTSTGTCVNPPTGALNRVGSESPTGDGKYGQADLAGNVYEWTLDWYATAYGNPCTDCANLTTTTSRTLRGGAYGSDPVYVAGGYRDGNVPPGSRTDPIGVRCARP